MAEKKIVLIVNKEEFAFNVTTEEFNRYINEIKPDDKVLPAKRFLRRTLADQTQREALDELIDLGLGIQLVGELIEEFHGEIEIEVKK